MPTRYGAGALTRWVPAAQAGRRWREVGQVQTLGRQRSNNAAMTLGDDMDHTYPACAKGADVDTTPTDAPSAEGGYDAGIRLMRHPSGGVVIMLDPDAAGALSAFLDGLPQAHDLIADAFDAAGVEVITALRGVMTHR